jgi:hypothetical protein
MKHALRQGTRFQFRNKHADLSGAVTGGIVVKATTINKQRKLSYQQINKHKRSWQ